MLKDGSGAEGKGKAQSGLTEIASPADLNRAYQQLAAIVDGSDDAILTKDLHGTITSWNRGATRIFGYSAPEVIGKSVTILIPPERHNEEPEILDRIRRGERIDHYETQRRRKDGQIIYISLTVSPLRDEEGTIVGASKIARDITERHLALEQQELLLAEMQHRIKNVFALAESLINLCAKDAETSEELAELVRNRLHALAHAHGLTVPRLSDGGDVTIPVARLHSLIATLAAPSLGDQLDRLKIEGEDADIRPEAVTPVALVLNEIVTNATKYGALRDRSGKITVSCSREEGRFTLRWVERSQAPKPPPEMPKSGFGARLIEMTVRVQLGGEIRYEWLPDGLLIVLSLDPARFER